MHWAEKVIVAALLLGFGSLFGSLLVYAVVDIWVGILALC